MHLTLPAFIHLYDGRGDWFPLLGYSQYSAAVGVRGEGEDVEKTHAQPERVSFKGSLAQRRALVVAYCILEKCRKSTCYTLAAEKSNHEVVAY